MKKVKVSFDTWVQLLGMVGVLGGLVFVGLEMQQTQKIAPTHKRLPALTLPETLGSGIER